MFGQESKGYKGIELERHTGQYQTFHRMNKVSRKEEREWRKK
jgi:hypothetical protein